MKALVIYDTKFGNTREVAEAIAGEIGGGTVARQAENVDDTDLRGLDLLIVGSPTQAGRPTKAVAALLKDIPAQGLRGTSIAAFDTRIAFGKSGFFLRTLMRVLGYAAPKIDATLRARGGTQVAQPEGFIVTGGEGPLADGEREAAVGWAETIEARLPVAV